MELEGVAGEERDERLGVDRWIELDELSLESSPTAS